MTSKRDERMTVLARTPRGVLGLGRFLVGICIVGTALWVSSPQSVLALNQEELQEEEVETGCGSLGKAECSSISFCIDLWKIITVCSKHYTYYPTKKK